MLMAMDRIDDSVGVRSLAMPAVEPDPRVDLRYFVMLTEPSKELAAELRLRNMGFDPYVPKETKLVNYGVRSGRNNAIRKRQVTRPIFRGYLFLPLNRAWSFGPIYRVDGLRPNGHCFHVVNGRHVVLRQCDVDLLRQAERVAAELARPGSRYRVGDNVKYVEGPFADLIMKIVNLDDPGRIELLSDIFKGSSKLFASVDQIEPA